MAGGWCENRRAGVCDQTSVHTEAGTQHFAVIITEKAPSPFLKHLNFVDTFTSVWGRGVWGVWRHGARCIPAACSSNEIMSGQLSSG